MGTENLQSRAPYGARGLKCCVALYPSPSQLSRPVWGAWIEILKIQGNYVIMRVAPRMGRVD